MQATTPSDVAETAAGLSHLTLHPHGSTDTAQDDMQQSDPTDYCSLGERAISPHIVNILKSCRPQIQTPVLCSGVSQLVQASCGGNRQHYQHGWVGFVCPPQVEVNSLSRWLRNHGRALSKLQVVLPDDRQPLVEARNQHFIRGLAAVTNLTTLSVACPGVYGCMVPELASLQSLQQLELVNRMPNDEGPYLPKPCAGLLRQLTERGPL